MKKNINVLLFVLGCGFIFKEQDIITAKTIIRDSFRIESLPQLTFGYTSNIKVSISLNTSTK